MRVRPWGGVYCWRMTGNAAAGAEPYADTSEQSEAYLADDEPWLEGYLYPDQLGFDLPVLVLGLEPTVAARYPLDGGREWHRLVHQASGLFCEQRQLVATRIALRPELELPARELSQRWYDSQISRQTVTLDDLVIYRDDLRVLFGVDCSHAWRDLREGVYPIDASAENLAKLSDEAIGDLADFIDWSRFDRAHIETVNEVKREIARIRLDGKWRLWLLGQNSD